MPKDHINLPERVERRNLINAIEKETAGNNIQGYEAYVGALAELHTKLELQCEINDEGKAPALTADIKADIEKSIRKTLKAGEAYLRNAEANGNADALKQGVPALVIKLQNRMAKDLTTLSRYDIGSGKALPEVLNENRSRTINTGNKVLDTAGGASHAERFPMNITDRSGRRTEGFFTKKVEVGPRAQWDALVDSIISKYPSAVKLEQANDYIEEQKAKISQQEYEEVMQELEKDPPEVMEWTLPGYDWNARSELKRSEYRKREYQKLNMVLPRYKAKLIEKDPKLAEMSDDYFAHRMLRTLTGDIKKDDYRDADYTKKVTNNLKKLGFDLEIYDSGGSAEKEFAEGIANIYLSAQEASASGHKVGDRVDDRSTTMSAVAGLLGKPDLLAHASDMKIRDAQGNVTEGTFMEKSKGLDLFNSFPSFGGVCDEPFAGPDRTYLRQLADIQVMDYLSGNVNRHFGNMTYEVDDQGRLISVQGFNNESSYGLFANGKAGRGKLAGTDDLGVISASMAKKIKTLDLDVYRATLRSQGRSPEEIDFAIQRMTDIKHAIKEGEDYYSTPGAPKLTDPHPIKKGHLRTVPDKDFDKLYIQQLWEADPGKPENNMKNIFSEVEIEMAFNMEAARRAGCKFTGVHLEGMHRPTEVRTADSDYTMDNFSMCLRGSDKLVKTDTFNVDDLTTKKRGGSQKFADMVKAMKKLDKMQDDFLKMEAKGINFSAAEYKYNHEQLAEAIRDLEQKNNEYQAYKMDQRKAKQPWLIKAKNTYEKNRIDYSMQVGDFVKRAKRMMPKELAGELTEDEKNYFKTVSEQNRQIRQKEFKENQQLAPML